MHVSVSTFLSDCEWLTNSAVTSVVSMLIWITVANLGLIHDSIPIFCKRVAVNSLKPFNGSAFCSTSHYNNADRKCSTCGGPLRFLTYQLRTVGSWPTVAMTGDGELGFDSGEGA